MADLTPVDLDALDAFLMSDRAPENGMGLSDLDGFLTGIVIGPELIMPSEWLPVVWGGVEPAFGSMEEARSVLGTIMGRYNEIIRILDAAPEEFDPVFWETGDGRVIVTDWAAGFLDAVSLRAKSWEPLIRHKEAGVLMAPLLMLSDDDPEQTLGGQSLPSEEMMVLFAEGAEIIPGCVVGIHAFWRERSAPVDAGGGLRRARNTSRQRRR